VHVGVGVGQIGLDEMRYSLKDICELMSSFFSDSCTLVRNRKENRCTPVWVKFVHWGKV
jgi:hypothetical protein